LKIGDFANSIKTVMPDLIRHPESIKITVFRPQVIPDFERGQNDNDGK